MPLKISCSFAVYVIILHSLKMTIVKMLTVHFSPKKTFVCRMCVGVLRQVVKSQILFENYLSMFTSHTSDRSLFAQLQCKKVETVTEPSESDKQSVVLASDIPSSGGKVVREEVLSGEKVTVPGDCDNSKISGGPDVSVSDDRKETVKEEPAGSEAPDTSDTVQVGIKEAESEQMETGKGLNMTVLQREPSGKFVRIRVEKEKNVGESGIGESSEKFPPSDKQNEDSETVDTELSIDTSACEEEVESMDTVEKYEHSYHSKNKYVIKVNLQENEVSRMGLDTVTRSLGKRRKVDSTDTAPATVNK